MILQLPYPPTANNLFRNVRKGRVKTDAYKAWLTEAGWMLLQQRPTPVEGIYRLTVILDRPDRRARDLDNTLKAISDSLKANGVIEDDSKCQSLTVAWAWDTVTAGGKVAVLIEPASFPIFLMGRAA